MERSTIDLWVGLFVVAGFGALVILALKVGNMGIGGAQTYEISALFTNIGGLKPRAAVKSAGVVVGRVNSISFDNDKFQAKVTMDIDGRFKFPKDTSASILTAGLLGEQYIGLLAGWEEATLGAGGSIQPSMTSSAVVLEELIGKFFSNAVEGGKTK